MPHHLPKLTLPSFNGEIMNWPTFWDSFSFALHNNPRLPNIQKFSYLKSLMQDEAARTIEGFTLCNANYQQAINLLQQRYGQIQKITAAYMSNLLQLPSPAANIRELRYFYDRLETNIRGLEALGEAQDSYGNLLIPIILERLSSETRRNLARENKTKTWTLSDLRQAIYREIDIMDAGNTHKDQTYLIPTASFHTGVRKETTYNRKSPKFQREVEKLCVFCERVHQDECNTVSDISVRISIVKKKELCFNCLSKSHQAVNCPSRFRCRKCKGKHHSFTCESSQESSHCVTNTTYETSQNRSSSHNGHKWSNRDGAAI